MFVILVALSYSKASADIFLWVQSPNAPYLYVFNCDAIHDNAYKTWPGKVFTTSIKTSDGKTWWFCKLGETTTTSIILNNKNSGDDKKTADINNLTSGVYYFYYDNNNFYLDLTSAKDALAYAFLQPSGTVDWTQDGAEFVVDGSSMIKCGGYNNGKDAFIWTSPNEKSDNIIFERKSQGGIVWNSFSVEYHKGGFYETTGWDSGNESDSQYRDVVFPTNGVAHDSENFPDVNFRNWLTEKFPVATADGFWSPDELLGVTDIDCRKKEIESLKGIENFVKLKSLNCFENKLTEIDLSKNIELTSLTCYRRFF